MSEFIDRIEGLRAVMRAKKVDAMLVLNLRNVRYLTGFTGSSAFVFVTRDRSFFYTDFRYKEQAEAEVKCCELGLEKGKRARLIGDLIKKLGPKNLGFESSISFDFYQSMHKLPLTLLPLEGAVEKLRLVKDSRELKNIEEATRRAEEAFIAIKPRIKPGVTERSIALRLEEELKKRGCRRIPFDIIVASGRHSSMPHAGQTDKKIEKGDFVIIDWGGEAGGYYSDMTRTLLMAGPDVERKKQIYDIVDRARKRAIAAVREGRKSSEIDAAARQYIKDAGYGDYFGHGTGHGIGLDVHEAPRISWAGRETLLSGMVFSIEPGIYLPGLGGVRIEDLVLVEGGKGRTLTKLDRRLEIIDR
ncbi:MAG TPA: Xaa-Pro peptidase family protein [Dissulfurispiraceae bacterium]|nr:Xaa-Pro peptidase family protein [Dissulfurispiraceae bacterium]